MVCGQQTKDHVGLKSKSSVQVPLSCIASTGWKSPLGPYPPPDGDKKQKKMVKIFSFHYYYTGTLVNHFPISL